MIRSLHYLTYWIVLASVTFFMLGGCSSTAIVDEPVVDQQPADNFIQMFDSQPVKNALGELTADDAHVVKFERSSAVISDESSIDFWVANNSPVMVAVQGTAGAAKYQKLGEDRSLALAAYLRGLGVDSIMVDYVADRAGMRGLLWTIDQKQAKEIYRIAPALIIYGDESVNADRL